MAKECRTILKQGIEKSYLEMISHAQNDISKARQKEEKISFKNLLHCVAFDLDLYLIHSEVV